ncbi:MAG: amidohydrolase family protein [Silicimonas sp.]|nr:amidohydrolase family protein [Silicimonas sp.]
MAHIRIDNATIITMDTERRIIELGSVVIEGDRIVAVGATENIALNFPAEKVIDGNRMAVMPGLIDVHAHAGHGLIKSMGGGDSQAWYETCAEVYTTASDTHFWHAEAALAGLERLKSGVTCGVSLLGGGDSVMRTDDPIYGEAHLDAIRDLGIRVVLAVGPCRATHPWTYANWEDGERREISVSFEQQIATSETLIKDHHGTEGGRLNICMLSPTLRAEHLDEASANEKEEMIRQAQTASRIARENDLVFTQDGHKTGTVQFAKDRLGILGPEALLSHSTDFTDDEIAICADFDVKIAHNASAIGSVLGRCRAIELMDAGVTVGIGSDATAPDRSGDMFRHVQQAMHYHRRHFRDPNVLPPGKALEMITIDAAKALGMDSEIGSLEVGKKADVIALDLAKPHLFPHNMVPYRVACFANGADVDTVIVNGNVLMQNRQLSSVDEGKVLNDAQYATETMLERTGRRALTDIPEGFFGATRY